MLKIRIWGKKEEAMQAVEQIKDRFDLLAVSPPYKDRGESKLVRVYVEADLLPDAAPPQVEPAKPKRTTRKKKTAIQTHFSFDDMHATKTLPKADHVNSVLLHPEEHKTPKYQPKQHTKIRQFCEHFAYDGDKTEKELPIEEDVMINWILGQYDRQIDALLKKNPAQRDKYSAKSEDIQKAADEIAKIAGVVSFPFSIAKKLLWFGSVDEADFMPREWKHTVKAADMDFIKRYKDAVSKYRSEVFDVPMW